MKSKHLILIAAALVMCACKQKNEPREKAPIRVKTEVVAAGITEGLRTYVGVVEEAEATAVSFTSMGTVKRVYVSEGQRIGRGQLIAEIDDTQARNVVASSQAAVTQAEDALQRYSLLHERGSMPESQWVEVQSKVTQARSQLALAKKNLADCRLTAPVSGIIGRKNVNAGETAMPSQAVVTILDVGSVKVKFSVPEAEMQAINAHTPSIVTVDAIGRSFAGGRMEKGVQADALTHTYDVRVRINNSGRALLPGMVASVALGQDPSAPAAGVAGQVSAQGAVTVPLRAVQRRPDGSLFVWSVDKDSRAHRTAVEIGSSIGNGVEILSGLSAGDRFVVEGYQKISEGSKVVY